MIWELPPRARRIHFGAGASLWLPGTTSACAENTADRVRSWARAGNYLRVRGEYSLPCDDRAFHWELPPRARRIRLVALKEGAEHGTTSACAENTSKSGRVVGAARNYLRVRGEYLSMVQLDHPLMELPPRARRIPNLNKQRRRRDGTTSACAENTHPGHAVHETTRNYLRVRGEY